MNAAENPSVLLTGPERVQLRSLTSLRAMAAIAVAIHHSRSFGRAFPPFDWIAQIGWLGVSLFFVLSGFVLMYSFGNGTGVTWLGYTYRRLTRIYPLHILCLVLSLAAFKIIHAPLAGYTGTFWGTFANALLIHGWVPGHPEIRQAWNGVSWTLSCEFFFYLLAPPIFGYLLKMEGKANVATAIAAWLMFGLIVLSGKAFHSGAILDWAQYHPGAHILEFIAGAAGARLLGSGWPQNRGFRVFSWLLTVPLIMYCILVAEPSRNSPFMLFSIMPAFFLLIANLAAADLAGKKSFLHNKALVLIGDSSYSLYMIHALWLGVCYWAFSHFTKHTHISLTWWNGALGTLVFISSAVSISIVMHLRFEVPVRRFLLSSLSKYPVYATCSSRGDLQ